MKVVVTRFSGGQTEPNEKQTLGLLTVFNGRRIVFECNTLEKPWLNNKTGVSCIPDGKYKVKKWHETDAKAAGKRVDYNHFELTVPNRVAILIHVGNRVDQIHGCLLVGDHYTDMNADELLDIGNSKQTLAKLFNILPDEFELTVISI